MTQTSAHMHALSLDDNGLPVITTERLRLRAPKADDLDATIAFLMSERASGIGGPHSLGAAWRVFATICGHWQVCGYGLFVVTRKGDDTPLAIVGPWTPGDWPETEVGWSVIDPAIEGTGIATEAAQAVIRFAFHELGWDTIVHYIREGNTRSIRLAEKLGATLDVDAPQPDGKPCLVYRQPAPQVAA